MTTYIYRDGQMVDKATGAPMLTEDDRAKPLQTPRAHRDLPGYRSPIDGSWVEGRRARRYDMEKNNCVDANDISTGPKRLKNRAFAEKHGATHLLEQ